MSRKSGTLTYPEPLGPPRPVAGNLYLFTFYNSEIMHQSAAIIIHTATTFVQWYTGEMSCLVISFCCEDFILFACDALSAGKWIPVCDGNVMALSVCSGRMLETEGYRYIQEQCNWSWLSGNLNTFTAIVDLSRFNNSCLKSPASTLVDLTFQSRALRSFSLNQLRNLSL